MISDLAKEIDLYTYSSKRIGQRGLGMGIYYPLLYSLILGLDAKSVFEFGVGLSTKVILTALQDTRGRLLSCDVRGMVALYGIHRVEIPDELRSRWVLLEGYSEEALKELTDEKFDFILHDGAHKKREVEADLETILPRLRPDGILVIHDVTHPAYDLKEGIRIPRDHKDILLPHNCGVRVIQVRG